MSSPRPQPSSSSSTKSKAKPASSSSPSAPPKFTFVADPHPTTITNAKLTATTAGSKPTHAGTSHYTSHQYPGHYPPANSGFATTPRSYNIPRRGRMAQCIAEAVESKAMGNWKKAFRNGPWC
ncbi:hypothetical protein K491DRAFT_685444 [Lophiostoma macrostomum CBS 122681]|uniref:Uncharacterized protein n=1 Tax=Lophiostoma macrostomum CBS 122681 TaxID=1314788 RepID=A0A6A6SIX5_9PLEO|nr:hypothetical protein K491DRAFT_685444 [Lophiostoma macrostomum CBS 122681]